MREYTVSGKALTVAGSPTLVIINPAASRVIEITGAWASQIGTTTQQQLGIEVGYKASVFGTYVSATPAKVKTSDAVSGITGATSGAAGTAGVNASAEGAGAITTIWSEVLNNFIPWTWNPLLTLGQTVVVSGADALAFYLKLQTTPTTLTGWNFGIQYREIG